MLITDFALLIASIFVLVKSADYAVIYSSRLARAFRISEFIVSFFLIAFISCSPEATVAVISALSGNPEFGLGTLLGSNVADLLLVFGVIAIYSKNGVKVKSEMLRNDMFYLMLLLLPIALGFDGHFSRSDGFALIIGAALFFMSLSMQSRMFSKAFRNAKRPKTMLRSFSILALSVVGIIIGAYFTVESGMSLAMALNLPSFLIALTIVAIGTCMPELMFSIRAVRANHEGLALGDVLGNVIIDATFLVGLISIIRPFDFDPMIIYATGIMMFVAGALLTHFIRTERILDRREGLYLILAYIAGLILEFMVNAAI